ncbi:MAG: RNA 2'-phosphotransferase [Acidobacteriota bacterium]|nr:RNA 2'-phosphotransferase [Acidobacteriota bacterium]
MEKRAIQTSKFLSLVLRHEPEKIGISLDAAGWVSVEELLAACRAHGKTISLEQLQEIVVTNDKQRFSFSQDGSLIRANQGHSVEVELGYETATPPARLFHGTAERFLASIKEQGLLKGKRHHVHLSADIETATKVGQRHGKPVVLHIDAEKMQQDGFTFYLSTNGVWLTEHVAVPYLMFL